MNFFKKIKFSLQSKGFYVAVKNIYTHRFRTVEDAGPYGYGGHRQFLRCRQLTDKPQFFGSSWAPTPTGSVGSRRFLRRRQATDKPQFSGRSRTPVPTARGLCEHTYNPQFFGPSGVAHKKNSPALWGCYTGREAASPLSYQRHAFANANAARFCFAKLAGCRLAESCLIYEKEVIALKGYDFFLVHRTGLEPAAPSVGGWCSIQLSYRCVQRPYSISHLCSFCKGFG